MNLTLPQCKDLIECAIKELPSHYVDYFVEIIDGILYLIGDCLVSKNGCRANPYHGICYSLIIDPKDVPMNGPGIVEMVRGLQKKIMEGLVLLSEGEKGVMLVDANNVPLYFDGDCFRVQKDSVPVEGAPLTDSLK